MFALVAILGQLGLQLIPPGLKTVGNVLEEEQAEDDMFVLLTA